MDELLQTKVIPNFLCEYFDEIFIGRWAILVNLVSILYFEEFKMVSVCPAQRRATQAG